MKVIWSPEAERALYDILDYIAQDSPENAYRFISKLKARADHLARFPQSGRRVPERENDNLRELIEGNYRIIYRVKDQVIEVATVFEGHRRLREEEAKPSTPAKKASRRKK
ncbi:type II toxin-antitoxin system RelE/ParE family toxin [bacterium]|jgi:plasmid stabilization system protein ParE|nr:type II toxin-antitoxin system RelE/ParE family toxin [bacterium]